ncbi:unnamed protein product [Symbiodinium sp. KB8]|nr:unnamed protein product [Symbiodinium sp. KB8]
MQVPDRSALREQIRAIDSWLEDDIHAREKLDSGEPGSFKDFPSSKRKALEWEVVRCWGWCPFSQCRRLKDVARAIDWLRVTIRRLWFMYTVFVILDAQYNGDFALTTDHVGVAECCETLEGHLGPCARAVG